MKRIVIFIPLLLCISGISSQTVIQDKQEVYGTWKLKGSPYIIEGEAIVPEEKTLVIEPGVIVKFKTGENRDYTIDGKENGAFDVGFLRVHGTIKAEGSKNKLITFTRFGGNGFWGNIEINSRSNDNLLKYCWIEASHYVRGVVADTYDNATGAVSFFNSSGTIENCLFISNGWTAFNCKEGSTPIFRNNTLVDNEYGLECNSGSAPIIINTIIWNNSNPFYVNQGSNPHISYSLIQPPGIVVDLKDDGNNIIGVAPEFIDPINNDYGIKTSSPAYKKGKGGVNIGAL